VSIKKGVIFMERNISIAIFKENGDLLDFHNNVPDRSFRIDQGFVIIDLGERVYMYPIQKIGKIKAEEV
jgi:hypothetical protein